MPGFWRTDGTYSDGSSDVQLTGSNVMVPMDVQSHLQTTIQTHNAVSITNGTGSNATSWIDCNGYDKLAVTALWSASLSSNIEVQWSADGVSQHGSERIFQTGVSQFPTTITEIKMRYARVRLNNADATTQTASAWAYLKA